MGSSPMKIQRQPRFSATHPPSDGPMAGAMAVTKLPTPIMMPMFWSGACSWMILNMSGSAMPVPQPSRMRPHSSMGKLCAHAPHVMPEM